MAHRDLDWTRTGTLQAMGEWVRGELGAKLVNAVRANDAVLLLDEATTPARACEMALLYVPRLAERVGLERRGKYRSECDGTLKGRTEWLLRGSGAICVLVIREHDSLFLVDARCRPEEAEQLLLEYLPELASHFGELKKYKGARLVFDACPE